MELERVARDLGDALVAVDCSGTPFRQFQPGIGPYGEPQLVSAAAEYLNSREPYQGLVATMRSPDLLIRGHWALEFKLARPFGDNGKEAENWSVNLLHPYPGNVSAIGDCLKLLKRDGFERRATIVVGYEHTPPRIPLAPLFDAFEILVDKVARVRLGERVQVCRTGLVHPVHQQLTVAAWEVLGSAV